MCILVTTFHTHYKLINLWIPSSGSNYHALSYKFTSMLYDEDSNIMNSNTCYSLFISFITKELRALDVFVYFDKFAILNLYTVYNVSFTITCLFCRRSRD